jgi:elongator complex protein 3
MKEYFNELIDSIKKYKLSKDELSRLKIKLCSKYKFKKIPTDIEILLKTPIKDIEKVKKYLQTKPTRSLSGVSVVAIMTAPHECPHGKCTICPGGLKSHFGDVPQSYTGTEPATRRAIRNNYDPYLQVLNRLEQYIATGHEPEKIELIIMGGTFISTPKKYRDSYVKYAFKAMNDFSKLFYTKNKFNLIKFKKFFELPGDIQDEKREKRIIKKLLKIKNLKTTSLELEQKKNEKLNTRCVGLTIETRPDYGLLKHGNEMLRLGCTRVEIGIQSVYEDSLKKINRGHTIKDNIKSIATLKDLGFKINAHYMPGLYVSKEKDLRGMKQLFSDNNFKPDMLKIYPCMVVPGTKLEKLYKQKKYEPLNTKQAAELIAEFKQSVPKYCRIMRVQRDIPTYVTTAGVDKTNLRQYVQKEMKEKGIVCNCIRCREIGRSKKPTQTIKITYNIIEYEASNGLEFFISADKENNIVGFCRLRFPNTKNLLRKEITTKSSLVRELHVYGETLSIGKKGNIQHKGIGKKLLSIAEKISKKYNKNKIIVISGIGVREYYRKQGYIKQGPYMIKKINISNN